MSHTLHASLIQLHVHKLENSRSDFLGILFGLYVFRNIELMGP
jgi:hypothetical protein